MKHPDYYRQTPTGWEKDTASRSEYNFEWAPIDFTTLPERLQRKLSLLAIAGTAITPVGRGADHPIPRMGTVRDTSNDNGLVYMVHGKAK